MMVNPLELINTIKAVTNDISNNEKLAVPLLANRAYKHAQQSPNDQTLRLMANILQKMNQNGKIFITRGEFKNIYHKFNSRYTKAKEIFANELDITDVDEEREIAGKPEEADVDIYQCSDLKTSNALSNLWDEKGKPAKYGQVKNYDPKFAKQAETLSSLELSRVGYTPKTVKTIAGSDNYIICDASYETPKGEAHVLVPVEISKSGTIIPSVIISKIGVLELNKKTLKESIISSAGNSLAIDPKVVLGSLSSINNIKDYSEFELKALFAQESLNNENLTKNASNNEILIDGPSIVTESGLYTDDGGEVKIAEHEDKKLFASYLTESKGVAEFTFGKRAVDNGRKVLINKISSFGYNPQVSVSSVCDDSIIYAVSCDSKNGPVGFEAIVEMKNNKPMIPSIVAVKDSVFEFTKEGIDKIVLNQISDSKMVATVSPHYGLKPSELIEIISNAADNGQYKLAEDALIVLSETASHETYSKGLVEYMRSLDYANDGLNKKASSPHKCNRIVHSPTHQEALCGHLNLPLSKIAFDENGKCIPKYRKSMQDTYEGVLFNASKVLL
jgi:hypothetical protein